MSWKCDKCKNTYSDDVKPVVVSDFVFCPNCTGSPNKVEPIKKRADFKKIIIAIMIAALIVLIGAITSSVMLFISNQIPAAVTAATCGFVAVVILSSVADNVRKRNKEFLSDKDKPRERKRKKKDD